MMQPERDGGQGQSRVAWHNRISSILLCPSRYFCGGTTGGANSASFLLQVGEGAETNQQAGLRPTGREVRVVSMREDGIMARGWHLCRAAGNGMV